MAARLHRLLARPVGLELSSGSRDTATTPGTGVSECARTNRWMLDPSEHGVGSPVMRKYALGIQHLPVRLCAAHLILDCRQRVGRPRKQLDKRREWRSRKAPAPMPSAGPHSLPLSVRKRRSCATTGVIGLSRPRPKPSASQPSPPARRWEAASRPRRENR